MKLYELMENPKLAGAAPALGVQTAMDQHTASPIGSGTSKWEAKKRAVTMMGAGGPQKVKMNEVCDVQLDEISNKILGDYKKAAGADASAADKAGDFKRGDKRFKGIVRATVKQGDNDAKKHKEPGVTEGKKPDNYHIVNKDGKPASLASYADRASAEKDRDAKHPDAEVRQVGPRGKVKSVSEGQLEFNTPDPVVVVQDLKGNILDKINLSVAAQKYKLGAAQNIKNQLAHQNYTTIGNYVIVSPMSGQPQDATTTGQKNTFATGVAEAAGSREKFTDLKSWAAAAKQQGLRVGPANGDIDYDYSYWAVGKGGEVFGKFVTTRVPQNNHGYIKKQGVAEGSLNEFAPSDGGGDSGNYFQALASAWYNGTFDSGSLEKGIKSQEDVERLLQRGIVCPDGVTRKFDIGYNSNFDGVVISSDDYYEHADHDETDSRTGKPFGPYDYMEFGGEELDESAKWRDPKYKDQLYTQEKPDYNDTREYDRARWDPKPKGYKGRKEPMAGGEFPRTDPLVKGFGRYGVGEPVSKGPRKGLPSRDQITSLKGSIKDAHGKHHKPNLPEQGMAEGSELKQAKRKYNQAAKDANADQVGAGKKIDTMKNSLRQRDLNKQGVAEDDDAIAAFLARGGEVQKLKPAKPRKGEGWQGSSHIGSASGRGNTKGRVSGLGANTGKTAKPVVATESLGRATPKMPKARDPGHAVLAAKRSSGAAGQHTNKKRQAILQPKHQKPLTRDMDLGEGWKSALGGAALAGAVALGGGAAHAQSAPSGADQLPSIVAHITFKVGDQTVTKDFNLGTKFNSPGQASAAVEKLMKDKGIKYANWSLERVEGGAADAADASYLDSAPASAAQGNNTNYADNTPYKTSGKSSGDYMAKEDLEESIERRLMQMRRAGYDIT